MQNPFIFQYSTCITVPFIYHCCENLRKKYRLLWHLYNNKSLLIVGIVLRDETSFRIKATNINI